MKQLPFFFFLVFLFATPASADGALPDDFDLMIETDMKRWHAPGLGLAIVKDGKTILAKGYGVKSFKTNAPVDERTVFQAGSTTKAFASMALAMLIDEGKVAWDDPIIKHIPEFRMGNRYVQDSITIRDALRHSSGVAQISNINMFLGESLPTAWEMMADIGQQASFRNNWDYNNTTFGLSGLVVEKVTGQDFHEFVRDRILTPLGMDDTLMLDDEVRNAGNRAEAHQYFDGKDYEIGYPYIEFSQSAGMMNSTPSDMANWIEFLLAGGVWNGERLVSESLINEMMSPQILLEPASIYPAAASYSHNYYAYGLAWFAHDYKGHKVAMHTGSINGMSAIVGLIPDENIGVYVFINSDHIEYRHALMYKVFDFLLGNPEEDWSQKLYAVYHPEAAASDAAPETHPDVSPEALAGTYALSGSFPLIIKQDGVSLIASLGTGKVELQKQADNAYLVIDPDTAHIPSQNVLGIELDSDGKVTGVRLSGLNFKREE
ncbi:MAG: serine hydrolase [Kordiimonadaceae bacterium]|nr:serine hydrolase [Kordiimonadaceae bacterium]